MTGPLTSFDLLAVFLYVLVAVIAGLASRYWRGIDRLALVAALFLFAGFSVWRLGQAEDRLRAAFKTAAQASGTYGDRADLQQVLLVVLVLAALLLSAAWLYFSRRAGRWPALTANAALFLALYTAIRTLSFHPVDRLIYSGPGPLRINFLIDGGLTVVAAMGAALSLASLASRGTRPGGAAGRR